MDGIPNRIKRVERTAKSHADKSNCQTSMSAVITKGGKILAWGFNKKTTVRSTHAEINALKKMIRQKKGPEGATITIFRYLADDSLGMSKPCLNCMDALIRARVRKVNYFDYDGSPKSLKI